MATYGLDYGSYLDGQSYDGASVMSGVNNGVQQIIRESFSLKIIKITVKIFDIVSIMIRKWSRKYSRVKQI